METISKQRSKLVMEFGYIRTGHLVDAVMAERWKDKAFQHAPVAFRGARLKSDIDVLLLEALGELGDGDGLPLCVALSGGIISVLSGCDNCDGAVSRLLASEHATWSEIEAPRAAACAVLHHVTFSTAREYAEPEAGQVLIPNEIVPVPNLGGINKALRQLAHLNKDSSTASCSAIAPKSRKHTGSKRARVAANVRENQRCSRNPLSQLSH